MTTFKKLVAAVVTVVGLAGAANASDCPPGYKAVTVYQTVTFTRVVEVPYPKTVTKYDHCGKPYAATVTAYRQMEVEYTKQVPVTKYVKAY